ncbi:TetR family transcriptional regulator [Nocardia sp. R7R-8]|uniref:TetR family transcriptional regulator n=1 Tax=Nocardia sp. R7R-8 TaxID=3459304 RepID=UPI00403DBB7D
MAADVGVTAPAVYRHFRNKQTLLAGAIDSGLTLVEATVAGTPDASWDDRLGRLATAAAERRDLWTLLQREMRHLSQADRQPLETRFASLTAELRRELGAVRPDLPPEDSTLLVTAVLAVYSSQSVYPASSSRAERRRVLHAAAAALSRIEWPPRPCPVPPAAERPISNGGQWELPVTEVARGDSAQQLRREEVLATAIRLFHEHGYAAVSLDDIGAAAGMAGPSILYHFPSKADLLVEAFSRASASLSVARDAAGVATLDDLVAIYVDLGVRERLLFGVYVLEAVNLPRDAGRGIRNTLAADVGAWVEALGEQRPDLTDAERVILVHAARAVVNDVVRIGHLHERPAIAGELVSMVRAVLWTNLARTLGDASPDV